MGDKNFYTSDFKHFHHCLRIEQNKEIQVSSFIRRAKEGREPKADIPASEKNLANIQTEINRLKLMIEKEQSKMFPPVTPNETIA